MSFVQDLPIRPFHDAILFGCMQHHQLDFDSILSTVVLKYHVDVFPTMVQSQYFNMCLVLVEE